jgi:hypothetical protein
MRRRSPSNVPKSVRALLVASLLGLNGLACDVVQGFKHAGDALFPSEKTYLDAPGYQLVGGGYRQLVLLTSTELFVLARGAKEDDDSLYSIRYAVPGPCTIRSVGRYWAGGSVDIGQAWIAYFHDGGSRGTLSFSDTGCHVSPLTLPDAELPYARVTPRDANGQPETDRLLLLIRSEGRLLLVDPASTDDPEVLVDSADGLLTGVGKANVNLVLSHGEIVVFDQDWHYLSRFGDGVSTVAELGESVYFEDANGIQRATPTLHDDTVGIDTASIAADGCNLSFLSSSRRWLGFFSPCDDKTLAFYDEATQTLTRPELSVEDTRALTLVPDPNGPSTPKPDLDAVWAFFLRDIDYNAGTGTLVAHAPSGAELTVGHDAALERVSLDKSGDFGLAITDVDAKAGTGSYVRWEPDGTVTPLASNVLRDGTGETWADVMIDWDGTSGTLAQVNYGTLYPLLEHVPRRDFSYQDVHQRQALFYDYDGTNGTLAIGEPTCSPGTSHCERQYYAPEPVAQGVHHPDHAFLDAAAEFLPGIGFLDQYDEAHGTGRFQYRNLELGFTSTVSEGVSDFVFAGNGMLYAVPYGEGAGIWLARAK